MVMSAGVIASFGGEIAFVVASLAVAIFAAIIAMEMRRGPIVWAVAGFFTTFVVASAVHALL
jgi:hypothetical protein